MHELRDRLVNAIAPRITGYFSPDEQDDLARNVTIVYREIVSGESKRIKIGSGKVTKRRQKRERCPIKTLAAQLHVLPLAVSEEDSDHPGIVVVNLESDNSFKSGIICGNLIASRDLKTKDSAIPLPPASHRRCSEHSSLADNNYDIKIDGKLAARHLRGALSTDAVTGQFALALLQIVAFKGGYCKVNSWHVM